MARRKFLHTLLGASALPLFIASATAQDFDIPAGDLKAALNQYTASTGVDLIYPADQMQQMHTEGVRGSLSPDAALTRLLKGTGFTMRRAAGGIAIVHNMSSDADAVMPLTLAQAMPAPRAAVETVTVTSSKLGGADVQSIPIAITALSQEQLTSTQTAGGPDLVKQVPNLTFSKTNFTGYNIQIRGIGTQAISVATDPAVAVALNDIPFIRNHFFEQEFFDLSQAEVLRGPQGTLYGRNATAGVVNIISAKPTDQFEAMASADVGNYKNRRFEGMVNIPIVDDRLDIRVAGEWTKRDGYTTNADTGQQIDGRDLWSGRVTVGWKPFSNVQTYLVWEHFQEDDDRMRTAKQLCKKDPGPASVEGIDPNQALTPGAAHPTEWASLLSQGCIPASLYSPESFETPNGNSLPYVIGAEGQFNVSQPGITTRKNINGPDGKALKLLDSTVDPYASTVQSQNLRVIDSIFTPIYKAKNDTLELNTEYAVTPSLTFTSQTGYNNDFLYSLEDFNRFNTSPGIFTPGNEAPGGVFCDPQLGCTDKMVAEDLSDEHAWQVSQEFRLASNFSGPLNFSFGGNYLHYETEENYYVFINVLTEIAMVETQNELYPNIPGVFANFCQGNLAGKYFIPPTYGNPNKSTSLTQGCTYIDPNPISSLNNQGHNYFLSENPYLLDSYAGFGEVYYQVTPDLKLTGGLRWTDDRKHFVEIPSWTLIQGEGYPANGAIDQEWQKFTGRFVANWTPKLDFTDQSLIYASYSRGYKAGGANPPQPVLQSNVSITHPLTFAPEFVDAYELGTKNTALDGALTVNGDVFYYDYKGYQISQIVDRTSVNLNFDARVKGAELEATYEPVPGLKFSFAGGYEDTALANGSKAVDLMDRTAGNSDWLVVKPWFTAASNCILPAHVEKELFEQVNVGGNSAALNMYTACQVAYQNHVDPAEPFSSILSDYVPWDPTTAPNNGEGFYKDLSGNSLPNAPKFTTSISADYTIPMTDDWAATLHTDFYWQDASWARVENDDPYDRIHGYTNVNLALILTSQNGWQVMGYLKNVFNTTAITGTFLNSDDTGLTTNVFLTDPRLYGLRVTRNW